MDQSEPSEVISYRPVGVIRSSFTRLEGMPPQSVAEIGLSVVRLLAVTGNVLEIGGADLLDGTILDIKPYVPEFDSFAAERTGWLERAAQRVHEAQADGRFEEP